ncbi:hypothetical protein HZA75_00115 [Candidatus Roizmanbacteria bacterium]|nr:hypothetical protein [Candidatus Roizmanbacteria bacterium]
MNILFYIWQWLLFIFFVFWLVLLPGYFVLELLKVSLTRIEKFTVSLAFGVSGFTLLLYIFGSLNLRFLAYAILSGISIYTLLTKINFTQLSVMPNLFRHPFKILKQVQDDKISSNLLSSVFIAVGTGTVILGSLLFRSGWSQNGGLSFTEYRDSFWHLGLMEELLRQIPPLHPGFAPLPLTNYHYFTHLFGAGFLGLNVFNSLDFYFRLFPFLLTFLYGLSLHIVGRALTKNTFGANLSVIFGYFTGSFAYVLPFFIKYPGFDWHESSFWLSQPFSMVINPSFALSAGLFLIVAFLLTKIIQEPKWQWGIPLIIISGTLISFKVYAGILVLVGLLVCGIWYFFKARNPLLIISAVLAAILSLLLFIPVNGKDAGNFLVFSPGWFLRSLVESPDRVQIVDWILRENTYAEAGNMLAILRYRLVELLIYLMGNLGVRVFGFITVIKIIISIKREAVVNIFLLAVAFAGIIIPLLFVQDGSIANTVQFSYYSLIIFSLWLAVFLTQLLLKRKTIFQIIILVIFLILAIPTSVKTWNGYVTKPSSMTIRQDEMQAMAFLANQTKINEIILVPATYRYTESLFVGTLSNRRLYYSDRLMAENTHKDFKEREANLEKFYQSKDTGWNTALLKNNSVSYVYVDKAVISNFNPQYYPLKKVFTNDIIDIYKVI